MSEDFSSLTDTALPAGWTSSGSSELDYTSSPYYGVAAPSYKFKSTGQWLLSPEFPAGAASLQFWAYGNAGAGSAIAVEALVGAAWTSVGSASIAQNGATYEMALNAQSTRLRFTFTKVVNCAFDDVVVLGAEEYPNLSAPSSLLFSPILPGASSTQYLALANSGASNTLHLASLSPASGDSSKFAVGVLPASLSPGATAAVSVVYSPGAVTGATHSAIFNLVSDDPSSPSHPITFSGSTIGASLTISNVQYNASGTNSPHVGKRVSVSGVATYADPFGYAVSDPAGGPWSGVYVADVFRRPNPGDLVSFSALVQESNTMTVLGSVSNFLVLSTNWPVPVSTVRGNSIAAEAYEGVLVRVTNVVVRNVNLGGSRVYWQAGDSSANFRVGVRTPYRYVWSSNATLQAIQGLVFNLGTNNFLQPRFDADFVGRPMFEYALRGLVVTPGGPRTNWTVHVCDDLIVSVTNASIPGIPNVDTGGIIFPGLIDSHNHPAYNSFPTLMFDNFPFGHRDQWGEEDAEYDDWKIKRSALRSAVGDSSQDLVTKYGECLELMAGCVAIQGQSNSDPEHSHPAVILYNVEQFPSRTWQDIFPWTSSAAERTELLAKIAGGAVNASMIHLCEGIDATARAQFAQWRDWGMLDETTAIIHGAALQPADFAQMAAAGAKLVWSPMSNMKLYGGTANVKAAKDAGVVIGLAPDWTPSGCFNILEELGYAWELNSTMFSNAFSAREMTEMVTLNNAKCAGLERQYGQIAPGFKAGLCVIEGDPSDPYASLIHARPPSVLLTIVDGTPRYGDPSLMAALGAAGESLDVKGRSKKINVAVNHPFLDYSGQTFSQIQAALRVGHASLSPTNQLDRDELQFLDLHLLQCCHGDDVPPFRADSPLSASPSVSVVYDRGSNLSLAFRYQDFWDNDTYITNLAHTISIAPARYSNLIVQTIATNRPNAPAHQTVPFSVGFQDMHTNYVFVFETRDARGNVRTTVTTNSFKLAYRTGGDTDRDGIANEWEIAHFGSFTGAVASANPDGDWMDNLQEYAADTLPTNAASRLTNLVAVVSGSPLGTLDLLSPSPTSAGRLYDVWWTTNLLGPVVWQPVGLDVPGRPDRASVSLRVTNSMPGAFYRTGVKVPSP